MTTLKSRLRAGVLGIALAGGVTVWPAYACGDERGEGSKQSDIGAVTGLAVGAVAGGPFGAVLGAAAGASTVVDQALGEYGELQGDKAVNIAAHAHAIEFGMLAVLLAFFQPYVHLREVWKKRWAAVLLLGSLLLPVCVFLEMRYGLVAGGIADFAGLLVIVALIAMWMGILRYAGALDASSEPGGDTGGSQ